jgi:hypothetical protein
MFTRATLLTSVTLAAALLGARALSAGEQRLPYEEIRAACEKFLRAYSSEKDRAKMAKKLKMQVETRVADTGVDEDRAMRDLMLDWAAGNASRLERKERGAIVQACFYFMRFIDKGYLMPGQIRERLTVAKAHELIDYLETEAVKVRTLASR